MQIHLAQSNSLLDIYLLEINSLHTFKKSVNQMQQFHPECGHWGHKVWIIIIYGHARWLSREEKVLALSTPFSV